MFLLIWGGFHLSPLSLFSREKQRLSRLDAVKVSSPVGSDSELDSAGKAASLRLAEAGDKLAKHR